MAENVQMLDDYLQQNKQSINTSIEKINKCKCSPEA